MSDVLKVMLVAGEPSGDGHGARLVEALRQAAPEAAFEFFGSAGVKMREAGVEPVVMADDLAIMGIPEIAWAMSVFVRAFRKLKRTAIERRPDVVILIDFPEFNLKLAKSLKKNGLRTVYYISPQLWGWREYRRKTIRDHVDLLLTILPFEKDWYAKRGIENVEYVGSPLANEVKPSCSREEFRTRHSIDIERKLVALLPGSRHKEIVRILPPMLEAAAIAVEKDESLQFVIALASTRQKSEVDEAVAALERKGIRLPPRIFIVKDETYDAVNASDTAAVASGTATLETGIIGTPMVIVYKTTGLNYRLIRPLIRTEHFGLINLIAGKRVAAEMIQDDFTPQNLAAELLRLLDPGVNARARGELKTAAEKLGTGGASLRAANAILELISADEPRS